MAGFGCRPRAELASCIIRELQLIALVPITGPNARYIHSKALFGPQVIGALPEACYDIELAGDCMAIGLNTAAVFHLMRVVECGLRALASKLRIPDPTSGNRNWGGMLRSINDAIARRKRWRKGERQALVSAVRFLEAVKDAWRNPCMHVEAKYDSNDARRIFNAVEVFTGELAKALAPK